MWPSRRTLVRTASLLALAATASWADTAEACDWAPGIVTTYPSAGTTLAANDRVVVSVLESAVEDDDFRVQVDGVDVPFQVSKRFDGRSVFLSTDFFEITPDSASLTEGSSLTVDVVGEDGEPDPLAVYNLGAVDDTPLLPAEPAASLEVEFSAADEGDSCGVPDQYRAFVTLDEALSFSDGERSRFLVLTVHPANGGPDAAVGRSVRVADEPLSEISASAPGDLDPATLCVRATVSDAEGDEQLLLEDCDLCESFPELCGVGGAETGDIETGGGETDGGSGGAAEGGDGCNIGTAGPMSWPLVLLGMLAGGVRRRRRSR